MSQNIYLSTPFEDECKFGEPPNLALLFLRVDGLQLSFGSREFYLTEQSVVQLCQLHEVFSVCTEALGLLHRGSDKGQL